MAVSTIAGAPVNEAAPTTTGTVTIPAVNTNDDLFLGITSRGHTSGDAYPGVTDNDAGGNTWTRLFDADTTRKGTLWWKKATGSSSAKVITITGAITTLSGGLGAFRGGLLAGNPATDLSGEANLSADTTHAGFTPSFANEMIALIVFNSSQAAAVSAQTCTNPGALTQVTDHQNPGASGAAFNLSVALQSGGPTATGNFTWTQSNLGTKSIVFAIRAEPPVAGGLLLRPSITL